MTHFDTPGNPKQSGGIFKVDEEDFVYTRGNGGVTLHIYVDSLSDTMEVSLATDGNCSRLMCRRVQKIVAAGGSPVSDVEVESEFGTAQLFEDTEGNQVGLYHWAQPVSPPQSQHSGSGN